LALSAIVCLRRAWIYGRGGYDETGRIKNPRRHIQKVQPWGTLLEMIYLNNNFCALLKLQETRGRLPTSVEAV
jgi:hypothetical protein